jgi:POT family proton-dependent oligopeptide transporter
VGLKVWLVKMDRSISHPKGLSLLFFTELWERFGFYTVQTIIILYMTQALLYSDENAYLLYGVFGSLIYFSPVLGGYIADRFIGFNQSIIIGGFIYIVGYILTAVPQESIFVIGMAAIVLANGFFKPCVSSLVGVLYQKDDPRRDSGFTIFYMGINIGALLPPLITGTLVAHYGWHWGFALAALGMGIGMITFMCGKKRLGDAGGVPLTSPIRENLAFKRLFYVLLAVGTVASLLFTLLCFSFPKWADIFLVATAVLVVANVVRLMLKEQPQQKRKMLACLILMLISVIFWAFYNQTFTTLMLFASRNMQQQMLGFPIDAEFTGFFNPFFIIILSPAISWLWLKMQQRNLNPSTPMKFSLGMLCMALGFLFLGGATAFFSSDGLSSPWWLAGSYFLQTIGELLLSPVGLAMITRLSPSHLVGMMMGLWFLMQATGFLVGSLFSTLADVPKDALPKASAAIYSHAFNQFGLLSMVFTIGCFLLVPYLKKLIAAQGDL